MTFLILAIEINWYSVVNPNPLEVESRSWSLQHSVLHLGYLWNLTRMKERISFRTELIKYWRSQVRWVPGSRVLLVRPQDLLDRPRPLQINSGGVKTACEELSTENEVIKLKFLIKHKWPIPFRTNGDDNNHTSYLVFWSFQSKQEPYLREKPYQPGISGFTTGSVIQIEKYWGCSTLIYTKHQMFSWDFGVRILEIMRSFWCLNFRMPSPTLCFIFWKSNLNSHRKSWKETFSKISCGIF